MDWNKVEGNWKQVKGKVKEQWGKLTDDDLDQINGKREQLEGKIQERYGYAKIKPRKKSTTGTAQAGPVKFQPRYGGVSLRRGPLLQKLFQRSTTFELPRSWRTRDITLSAINASSLKSISHCLILGTNIGPSDFYSASRKAPWDWPRGTQNGH